MCARMKSKKEQQDPQLVLGWREWVGLPELGLLSIKAKVDTGARTSTLHAFEVKVSELDGRKKVEFLVHPKQGDQDIVVRCVAEVIDRRSVRDSGGHNEMRWVIRTPVSIGGQTWPIEMTLTERDNMRFRMLLGRTAIAGVATVNPQKSYLAGGKPKKNGAK
jgi:hypothetical protein